MKIALILSHADRIMLGATRELTFCRALIKRGAQAKVFRIHKGAATEEEAYMGGVVSTVFVPADGTATVPHQLTSTEMVRQIQAFGPDVLIFKGLNYRINAFVRERMSAVPFGFIVGGSVVDPILAQASFVLGEYSEQLDRHFPGFVAAGRTLVLPKYVDLDACASAAETPQKLYDIVNIGNFYEKRKNQNELLQFSDRYTIACVGGGQPSEAFTAGVLDQSKVHLLGRLDREQVFRTLGRSKIMVHTSTMDGLPRSVVEAMSCGLPVVTLRDTVYGGLRQGEHGFLVNAAALRPAVELLLSDDVVRTSIGAAARAYATKWHGPGALWRASGAFMEMVERVGVAHAAAD